MVRARSKNYDKIKNKIIDKAAILFAQKGYPDTSISEIAEASGISKSGLYHYIGSKHDILFLMLSEYVEVVINAVDEASQFSRDPIEQFNRLTLSLMQTYSGLQNRHVVLMNELGSLQEKDREKVVMLEHSIIKLTENMIEKIKPEIAGEIKIKRPIVMLYFGMINWTYTWFDIDGRMHSDDLARLASSIFIEGLLATNITDIKEDI